MKINLELTQSLIEDADIDDIYEITKWVNKRRQALRDENKAERMLQEATGKRIRSIAKETIELTKDYCSSQRTVQIK